LQPRTAALAPGPASAPPWGSHPATPPAVCHRARQQRPAVRRLQAPAADPAAGSLTTAGTAGVLGASCGTRPAVLVITRALRVQGFQALAADQGGCGGLAADVLGALRDEYPRAPVLALPVRPAAGAAPGDADAQAWARAALPSLCKAIHRHGRYTTERSDLTERRLRAECKAMQPLLPCVPKHPGPVYGHMQCSSLSTMLWSCNPPLCA